MTRRRKVGMTFNELRAYNPGISIRIQDVDARLASYW